MKPTATLFADPAWLSAHAPADDIVLATVGRLVRNLRGTPFPGWSTAESRAAVVERVLPAVAKLNGFARAWHADMAELSYEQRRALLVRKLLTPCMAARDAGCHLVLPRRRHAALMVNEEEHIVLHTFHPGAATAAAVEAMRGYAAELQQALPLASDPAFGYLTSLPGEAGDGMQLYQVLHLPALSMAGMMPQVTRAIEKLHLSLSPFVADGSDDTAHTFVFYSVPGPQGSIDELAEYFDAVMAHLVRRERQVRRRLVENDAEQMHDAVGRAYGLLRFAHRLSLKELRDAVSVLRLGTVCGMLVWSRGPAAALAELRALVRRLSVDAALAPDADAEELSSARATALRDRLMLADHTLTNP